MVFGQLDIDESAIWSLLLASGYLKPDAIEYRGDIEAVNYYMNKVASEIFSFFDVWGKTGFLTMSFGFLSFAFFIISNNPLREKSEVS